ncbi:glycine cleavage system aminomethyltransferase GcvT [Microbacterium sp. JZ37]|uniref:glycine cleavage system aminomethyltransferase GcvT n=1 Tax=Microbacterium sp. JZ37 TaxID=2654193 RepID=UPI002B4830EF|nr:glycine cleavage system aminomethyltransferase GcvT [Microbacterium sp. JZ37]WRH17164.1 glycine cleavage system aminomethyltransferase GcvT [Microbacterium sp. JZ37]
MSTDESTASASEGLRRSPLQAEHEAQGASFTDFGGWWMPVRYTSDLAEHRAVREAAGLFDISHMGEILVRGAGAGAFLDYALAGRLSAVAVGRAKYTMMLAEDGGIIDDLVVYRLSDDEFLIIANAGNRRTVAAEVSARIAGFDADLEDASDRLALIALQGPRAQAILESAPEVGGFGLPLDELRNYAWTDAEFAGTPLLVARTGYTGEDGFELCIDADRAVELWRALLAAGAPHGLVPAGLAARDTLRLEAGMPLYGHELARDIFPSQAGLGRVVAADKGDFVGARALDARPGERVLVGLTMEGRRAGRAGYGVFRGDHQVGEITSGALSPTLGHPIALAYVDQEARDADDLTVDVRGTRIPATPTTPPFYRRKK